MKVYERYSNKFAYPQEIALILDYLDEHGTILVNESAIESLYCEFSDMIYSCCWMTVNDERLEEFEEWLNNYRYEFE